MTVDVTPAEDTAMVVKSTRWPQALLEKMEADADEAGVSFSEFVRGPFEIDPGTDDGGCGECGHQHDTTTDPEPDPVPVLVGEEGPELADLPPARFKKVDVGDGVEVDVDERIATIVGTGSLSESEDPETQADVLRVKELLDEGAVAVSVMLDMNPDEMPPPEVLEQLEKEGRWDELDDLIRDVHLRIRHVAIVDTAAFSDAHLVLGEDGSVSGPLVFEGPWTGDIRFVPFEKIALDASPFPIPIIWDREDGDHTGVVVGKIDSAERLEGDQRAIAAAAHILAPKVTDEQIEAVSAAAGTKSGLPARYFAKFESTKMPRPLKISAPDENGLRHFAGVAAPKGVCHRSDMGACFQFPGDIDKAHRGFHTGALIDLDDGTSIRVGAVTSGGMHVDNALAKQGVSWREQNRHREDSHKVLAMVRAWEDQYGHLCVSGIVPPDVTEGDLMRAMACSMSAELWPKGHGRTLVGLHMVPTPAWPVAASMGLPEDDGLLMASTQRVEIEGPIATNVVSGDGSSQPPAAPEYVPLDDVIGGALGERLDRIEQALGLLVSEKIADGIPDPDAE